MTDGRLFIVTYEQNDWQIQLRCKRDAMDVATFISKHGHSAEVYCVRTDVVLFFHNGDLVAQSQLPLTRYHIQWRMSSKR